MIGLIPQSGEQPLQIYVLLIDLESEIGHNSFELVFKLLIFFRILLEIATKDLMQEKLVPRDSIFLGFL
jgi:hypothetical protein